MYGYEIFHEKIMDNLISNVREGKAQHAYIFEGEEGIGSFDAALLFANALVCDNIKTAPCGMCSACIMAKAETHPDIHIVHCPDDKKIIPVSVARDILKDAYAKPYENGKKVYIIADEANEQFQNAFLKLLEEPPEYAVFIILSENAENLLPTIRSRCTNVRFTHIADGEMRKYIERNFPDYAEKADFLVQYAGGILKNVEKIASFEGFMPLREKSLQMLSVLLSDRSLDVYETADFIEENKDNAELVLRFWTGFMRDIMLIQNDAKNAVASSDYIDILMREAGRHDEKKIVFALEQTLKAQNMKKRYVNLRANMLRLGFTIRKGR